MKPRPSQSFATGSGIPWIALTLAVLLAMGPARSARRPRYGGTLLVEIGATVKSLDPNVTDTDSHEAAAEAQIESLLYVRPAGGSSLSAPGPFHLYSWDPGKQVVLAANDAFPGGRPFLDSVDISTARAARDRLLDLELGKADVVEIPPDQARRAADQGVRVSLSEPDMLLALVYSSSTPPDAGERAALASAVDRVSMINFIFQKTGDPAMALLPQWSSGMAFLFPFTPAAPSPGAPTTAPPAAAPTGAQAAGAPEAHAQIAGAAPLVLGYDSADLLQQSVAERIVVIAREAGIAVTSRPLPPSPQASLSSVPAGFDARLVFWTMPSPHPGEALSGFLASFPELAAAAQVAPGALPASASPQDIYEVQRKLLADSRIVPLVWLPQVYGLSARVRDWRAPGPGESWPLADVWLAGDAQ